MAERDDATRRVRITLREDGSLGGDLAPSTVRTALTMAGPPPVLRDSRLDLARLSAMARQFDQISREEGGQTWPATSFVEWLADERPASLQPQQHLVKVDEAA